ncbi:MAG: 23S rRNA (guanosine(2251)-2'-O)-methyltransferase RlmB [Gammaproteobacteria bacterium]|nr:MAG: 23S rRNA (guanosine(2251)-2'-O)-methyltransferase RlmB [Gammaproteobacteria bacterium]
MAKPDWVFGLHTVAAILERHPERILELCFQQGREDQRIQNIQALAEPHGIPSRLSTRQTLDELAKDGNHQGVVAKCRLAQPQTEQQLYELVERAREPLLLLVLDSVTDPHNLGACIRTADAVGAAGVITTRDKAAGLTPVVRRVAVGAAEVVPFFQVTNLARTLDELKQMGIWVAGSAIDETAKSLYDADLTGHLAMVMGAEGKGLRRLTKDKCDQLLYIPMQGSVDSLNVSVATGVCLFEAYRQRS